MATPETFAAQEVAAPTEPFPVYVMANANIPLSKIDDNGGVVPFQILARFGGSRVEAGTRCIVMSDVAEKLCALTHESNEYGCEGMREASFTLIGKFSPKGARA